MSIVFPEYSNLNMASEILSNLQLGSLILNSSKINALSATTGALISAPSTTITDSGTAASGTLTQFNAHYLAAPTLAATNTSVTTTTANTLTIGGAPTAGTNETLTNAYALNVLSGTTSLGGSLLLAGHFVRPASTLMCKTLTGSLSSANGNSSNTSVPITGTFDANWVQSGAGVIVPPGIWLVSAFMSGSTSTATNANGSYITLNSYINGSGLPFPAGIAIPFPQWYANLGIQTSWCVPVTAPVGSANVLTFSVNNALQSGSNSYLAYTGITLTVTLAPIAQYS